MNTAFDIVIIGSGAGGGARFVQARLVFQIELLHDQRGFSAGGDLADHREPPLPAARQHVARNRAARERRSKT